MWAGWLGDYARGELEGSIRPCADAVESRSGTNTCRPLLSAFCCSSKTRLLCKKFFNKYYKMGAAQKPKLFTRKTIKLGKRQIKTNKATQLKTLKNVNCRSPPFVTRMEAVISGLSGAWVPHTLGYTHGPDRALRRVSHNCRLAVQTVVGCHKTIKFNFVTVPRPPHRLEICPKPKTGTHSSSPLHPRLDSVAAAAATGGCCR